MNKYNCYVLKVLGNKVQGAKDCIISAAFLLIRKLVHMARHPS